MKKGILILLVVFFSSIQWAKGSLSLAISSFPQSLKNPFFATDSNSQNIHRLVHISLTDIDENMKFSCRLCEKYVEKVVGDEHRITFYLKKGVKFWDGSEVLAKDVENSWKYFREEKNIKSIFRFAFSKITFLKVVDPYTVELRYAKYSPDNISDLALFKIMKIKNFGKKKFDPNDIIGAGPYLFSESTDLSFKLSPAHNSKLPSLEFKTVKDETTLSLKLMNKEVDLSLIEFSPRKLKWFRKNLKKLDLKIWEKESSNYKYIGLNHKNKHLRELNVRKALSYLLPRKDLLKYKLGDSAILSKGIFSPAFSAYTFPGLIDSYNPSVSKKLLEKAGYLKGKSGYYEKKGELLHLKWRISNNKQTVELAKTIKDYFEKFGIKVSLVVNEWGTYYRAFKKGNYDLTLGQWIGFTGPEFFHSLFYSTSLPPRGRNRGRYKNQEMDRLIDGAKDELDPQKRRLLFEKVQALANNDYTYINLWHPKVLWVGRSCLKKVKIFPNGSFYPLLGIRDLCAREN